MFHRTYGRTEDCSGCRFWSEMLAMSDGGPVKAMCLSDDGPLKGKFVTGRSTCKVWKSGHFGAVDEPPDYGEEIRAAYALEDSTASPDQT